MPRRTAMAAASVRPVTPSLPKMLDVWVVTVRRLMKSAAPICASERPSTIRRSTSSSREVSREGECSPRAAIAVAFASTVSIVPASAST
jgi:hypothetical protein